MFDGKLLINKLNGNIFSSNTKNKIGVIIPRNINTYSICASNYVEDTVEIHAALHSETTVIQWASDNNA